ncbi:hypothetical protein A4X06_0g7290, partial [Tilletia controversa]
QRLVGGTLRNIVGALEQYDK